MARQTAEDLTRYVPGLIVRDLANDPRMASASKDKRRLTIDEESHVLVTTYSQLHSRRALLEGPVAVLILDEASALKGGRAIYKTMVDFAANAPRVHAFTATPYTNDPVETFNIVSCLHLPDFPDRATFERHFVRFRDFGATRKPVGWSEAVHEFRDLLGNHSFRRDDALDSLDLPDCDLTYSYVPLDQLRERHMDSTSRLFNPMARHQAQEKIARGNVHFSAGAMEVARRIWNWLRDDEDLKILVIGESLDELAAVEQRLRGFGIRSCKITGDTLQGDRADLITQFRDGSDVRVLIGSTVLQEGLNLQFCRILVSLGVPDNMAGLAQRQGRIVRQGSPFKTVQHDVILTDTAIDHSAVRRLQRKDSEGAKLVA